MFFSGEINSLHEQNHKNHRTNNTCHSFLSVKAVNFVPINRESKTWQ